MRPWLSLRSALWVSIPILGLHAVLGANPVESLDLGEGVALEIVRVEPGTFQQGSPTTEAERRPDETPRTVTLSQPFWLGKYPVTRGEFARFVGETRYRTEAEAGPSGGYGWDGEKLAQRKEFTWKNPGFPQTDGHPVVLVTYQDAKAFLAWLSRKTGRTFALPTEAQWEYACRAGSIAAFSGEEVRSRPGTGTQLVSEGALNAWGLGSLTGNVWQWCEDWYAPYTGSAVTDPLQTQANLSDKPRRVLRGGSWLRPAVDLRIAARYRNDAASRNADNGFRVMTFAAAPPARAANEASVPVPAPSVAEPDRITPVAPPSPGPSNFDHETFAPAKVNRGFPFMFLLGVGVVLVGFLVVLVMIIRRFAKSGATGVMPGNLGGGGSSGPLRTRIVDDGFWIESASLPTGTVLECRYFAGGKQHQSNVTFQGGAHGQFVFTGSRPSSVAVAVLPGGGPSGGGRGGGSRLGRTGGMIGGLHHPPPLPEDHDNFRRQSSGHPPAY